MIAPICVAIASGKGGTGKTTVATNLAAVLADLGAQVAYVDCDVEEPNGHLFLRPKIERLREVAASVPMVDAAKCTLCGACGDACRFSAIVALPSRVLTFPKLCHDCGGCYLACTAGAITQGARCIGVVEEGTSDRITFLQGRLNVGEAMAPPLIRALLKDIPMDGAVLLDAPPGTSCPVITSVRNADVVLLVTEPTPFGLNDLALAADTVRALGLPCGVVINRAGVGDQGVVAYCVKEGLPVLAEIPNDRAIAQAYSRGDLAARVLPHLRQLFFDLFQGLSELAGCAPRPMARPLPASRPMSADDLSIVMQGQPPDVVMGARIEPLVEVPELVVISGKGGTGKTSIVASLVALAEDAALADCDVDAADLHLVLDPVMRQTRPFFGGMTAVMDSGRCMDCGICAQRCRFDAIGESDQGSLHAYRLDPVLCEGCGVCVDFCPEEAMSLVPTQNGEWFLSDTRHGPMAHARLGVAQENSGKLVSLVRREGRVLAASHQRRLLLCDGSPGLGCPVIASITGARMALIVTEPTLSGLHDLVRVAEFCQQLGTEAGVCINKADLNPEIAERIRVEAHRIGLPVWGLIRYDDSVTHAQVSRRAVVEQGNGPAAEDIRALFARVTDAMTKGSLA